MATKKPSKLTVDHIIWYAKSKENLKFRRLYWPKNMGGAGATYRVLPIRQKGMHE